MDKIGVSYEKFFSRSPQDLTDEQWIIMAACTSICIEIGRPVDEVAAVYEVMRQRAADLKEKAPKAFKMQPTRPSNVIDFEEASKRVKSRRNS